jgi:hypothetical protein
MLNALVGDSGAGGTKGLVPAPAAGDAAAGKFLKADGTWTAVTSTLSGKFTSAEQTISVAGQLTLAHGLGVAPILMFAHLVCKTAEANYSVGDKVATSFGADSDANPNGMGAVFDATNITIRFASTGPFALPNKTTGNYVALTPANWKLVITAFA